MNWRRVFLYALPAVVVIVWWRLQPQSLEPKADLPVVAQVTPFELTQQDGTLFSSEQRLSGKVWVAAFMFTRCQGPCPMMMRKLVQLQQMLETRGLSQTTQLLVLSADPKGDTPEMLHEFALRHGAQLSNMALLTGDPERLIEVGRQSLRVSTSEDPDLHSTRFIVVDAQHRVRLYFDAADPDASLDPLVQVLEQLSREAGSLPPPEPVG